MRKLITNNEANCVGCNRCIRACPVEGANNVIIHEGKINVTVNQDRCVACGACIEICHHDVRGYVDDVEQFLSDLKRGHPISMIVAPANRINKEKGRKILAWLKKMGVRKFFDVSLGADICTWAHIRLLEQGKASHIITQPCPVIVDYIQMFEHGLVKHLSPVHSPMTCTAIYMKQYAHVNDSIAAFSPCISKAHEFNATGHIKYNVTFEKLFEYIDDNNIALPDDDVEYDHPDSGLGFLYPMPGGLKENIEHFFGKNIRVDQAEGTELVYEALANYRDEKIENLPDVFDVLNCHDGCNIGTAVCHDCSKFEITTMMDKGRKNVQKNRDADKMEESFKEFDRVLRMDNFLRKYRTVHTKRYVATEQQIEQAFNILHKYTDADRMFDCGACGSDTCREFARKVAVGIDLPQNCIKKLRDEIADEHEIVMKVVTENNEKIENLKDEITSVKGKSEVINESLEVLNDAIQKYDTMTSNILSIASQINLISLNATIESARAGQHGKAFSVVAEEIRNFANKAKQTVYGSGTILTQSQESIKTINEVVEAISKYIADAHENIAVISGGMNEMIDSVSEKN